MSRYVAARVGSRRRLYLIVLVVTALVALVGLLPGAVSAAPPTSVDLSTYLRTGRFDLPEPTRTAHPAGSLLAQEASGITYDWDTDSLFVVGDGGTSVVQVSKTGALIDSMTLAAGSSPQGTEFYDTEGISYVGGGKFALIEERYRQVNLFTYVAGNTLQRSDVKTVKLGTTIGNVGIEGVSWDPQTGGYIFVKEKDPQGIFSSTVDFDAGTASNGSPTTDESTNLFDPSLAGTSDFSDVFALSNIPGLDGQPDSSHLLIISQESGKVINVDRSGTVSSTLTLVSDPGNPLSIPDQTDEGVTMDRDGNLYVVNEEGGGDTAHPQLWVYQHSDTPNAAPTALTLANKTTTLPENTSTTTRLKVADVQIADDGLGTNNLAVTGPDASAFEVDSNGLYIKAGTVLDYETKTSYDVTVAVDDPNVGSAPDALATYHLDLTDVINEGPPPAGLTITEVAPWGSTVPSYAADWFEVTNPTNNAVDITGWKMDDDSASFVSAVPLRGLTSIPAGKSAVFFEGATDGSTDATITANFCTAWFGSATCPAGFLIGAYGGPGVGLSTGGDQVNLYDSLGDVIAGVTFGTATSAVSFDNFAGAPGGISNLALAGVHGAFLAADGQGTGSPGTVASQVAITEVAPWGSAASYLADWFEVTNTGSTPIDLTGWKMDDSSNSFVNAVSLRGVSSIPGGKSAIFAEGTADGSTDAAIKASFCTAWFGSAACPTGFLMGGYGGSGVGLSTGGDGVNLFDAVGNVITGVAFGAATTNFSFDNFAGLGSTTLPGPTIAALSVAGTHSAFLAADGVETGSPFPDTTAPVLTATPSVAKNGNGWNNTDVTVTYNCNDAGVGVNASTSSLGADVLSATSTASGTCVDRLGNSAGASYSTQIDKVAPAITFTGNNTTYLTTDTVAITCGVTETGSGIDTSSCPGASGSGASLGLGSHTLSATVTDKAGNTATASATFTVNTPPAQVFTSPTTTTTPTPTPEKPALTFKVAKASKHVKLHPHQKATIAVTLTIPKAGTVKLTLVSAKGKTMAVWTKHLKTGKNALVLTLPAKARHAGHYKLKLTQTGARGVKTLSVVIE